MVEPPAQLEKASQPAIGLWYFHIESLRGLAPTEASHSYSSFSKAKKVLDMSQFPPELRLSVISKPIYYKKPNK